MTFGLEWPTRAGPKYSAGIDIFKDPANEMLGMYTRYVVPLLLQHALVLELLVEIRCSPDPPMVYFGSEGLTANVQ